MPIYDLLTPYIHSPAASKKISDHLTHFFSELSSDLLPIMQERCNRLLPESMEKLAKINAPDLIKVQFVSMALQYIKGERGIIGLDTIQEPQDQDLIPYTSLTDADFEAGQVAIGSVGFLKLNGGLGTTMGCTGPKSAIPVHEGLSFLDFIVAQILSIQTQYGCDIPLIFLNSYNTEAVTAALVAPKVPAYINLRQHQIPRIESAAGTPAVFPEDPTSEWNPPGHGDIYAALVTSGQLDRLLARGTRYLFISNADNLGASIDLKTLGYMIQNQLDFVMETTPKTAVDRKGGTLVRHQDRLFLLERGQVAANQIHEFEDIHRFKVFNTNNIWIDLEQVKRRLNVMDLELPLIVNPKTIHGVAVDQLESAMGSAINVFEKTASIVVPRSRFMPVKSVSDLLILRSDLVKKLPSGEIQVAPLPIIELDPLYNTVAALDHWVPHIPSLKKCTSLSITGPVRFGPGVEIRGDVQITATDINGLHLEHRILSDESVTQ